MYFHNSLIPRGAYFLFPLESKQEATSGWNFTKCISEVKVNQLEVKNIHAKMGISTFKISLGMSVHPYPSPRGCPQQTTRQIFQKISNLKFLLLYLDSAWKCIQISTNKPSIGSVFIKIALVGLRKYWKFSWLGCELSSLSYTFTHPQLPAWKYQDESIASSHVPLTTWNVNQIKCNKVVFW